MAWDFKNVDPTILRYLYIQSEKISQLFITAYLTIYFKVELIEMTWFDILHRGNLLFKVESFILYVLENSLIQISKSPPRLCVEMG